MVRVLIADDQAMVRTGLNIILSAEADIEVVGEAANGEQAVQMARELHPDVVCMDIRMPVLDGVAATRILADPNEGTPIPVLIVTTFDMDDYVFGALAAGAAGFLLKDASPQVLLDAVRSVAAGEGTLDQTLTKRILVEFAANRQTPTSADGPANSTSVKVNSGQASDLLSDREREIVILLAQGLSNAEISEELFLEVSTVKSHLARLMPKIGARDRLQTAVWAYQNRLVEPAGE